MRLLVTGAGGFIGSHIVKHLLEKDASATVVAVDSFRHRGSHWRLSESFEKYGARLEIVPVDLSVPILPMTSRKFGDVQHIFHLASDSHVDRSIAHPRESLSNNINSTLNLLEYWREHRLPESGTFVLLSTDEVYGPAIGKWSKHREWSPIVPSNPYSAGKAAQEAMSTAYWRTYGLPLVIANSMNVFGPMQDCEKFLPKVVAHVLSGRRVPIHAFPNGSPGSRFYVHVADVAMVLRRLAFDKIKPSWPYEPRAEGGIRELFPHRFNIVPNAEFNNLELATLVAEALGEELKYDLIDFHSVRPGHDVRYALDGTSLRWATGIALKTDPEQIKETALWYRDNPEWLLSGGPVYGS